MEEVGHNGPHQPRVMVMQAVGMLMSATCHRIKLTIRQDITSCFGKMTPPRTVCERFSQCERRLGDLGEINRLCRRTFDSLLIFVERRPV